MSSPEWSRYMHDVIGLRESPRGDQRRGRAPHGGRLPGAAAADPGGGRGRRPARRRWPLGLASSSNRELIDFVLSVSGLGRRFGATVSSEEVPRGKPAPDVYLEAARRLGVAPSGARRSRTPENGIPSAKAAGMRAIAIPNPRYPPAEDALAEADVVPRLDRGADARGANGRTRPRGAIVGGAG